MEVSSLRDRRLVALFATVVIVASGAVGAVVSLEHRTSHRGATFGDAAFVPVPPEPSGPAEAPKPPVVVVVDDDPPPDPPADIRGGVRSPAQPPAPAPAAAAPSGAGQVEAAEVGASRRRPQLPSGSDIVIASDPDPQLLDEESKPPRSRKQKLREHGKDRNPPADDRDPAWGSLDPRRVDEPVATPSAPPSIDEAEPPRALHEPKANHDAAPAPLPAPEPSWLRHNAKSNGNAYGHAKK